MEQPFELFCPFSVDQIPQPGERSYEDYNHHIHFALVTQKKQFLVITLNIFKSP